MLARFIQGVKEWYCNRVYYIVACCTTSIKDGIAFALPLTQMRSKIVLFLYSTLQLAVAQAGCTKILAIDLIYIVLYKLQ